VLAISIAIFSLSLVRISSLKVAVLILWAFFFYDIFWVFVSPLIFGESVMYDRSREASGSCQHRPWCS